MGPEHRRSLTGNLLLQAGLLGVLVCTLDLVSVVVQADDFHIGKTGDLAGRAADAAADVQDAHLALQSHAVGKVVLMAGDGLIKAFAGVVAGEVKVRAPSVLVQGGCTVVVACGGWRESDEEQARISVAPAILPPLYLLQTHRLRRWYIRSDDCLCRSCCRSANPSARTWCSWRCHPGYGRCR